MSDRRPDEAHAGTADDADRVPDLLTLLGHMQHALRNEAGPLLTYWSLHDAEADPASEAAARARQVLRHRTEQLAGSFVFFTDLLKDLQGVRKTIEQEPKEKDLWPLVAGLASNRLMNLFDLKSLDRRLRIEAVVLSKRLRQVRARSFLAPEADERSLRTLLSNMALSDRAGWGELARRLNSSLDIDFSLTIPDVAIGEAGWNLLRAILEEALLNASRKFLYGPRTGAPTLGLLLSSLGQDGPWLVRCANSATPPPVGAPPPQPGFGLDFFRVLVRNSFGCTAEDGVERFRMARSDGEVALELRLPPCLLAARS